MAHCRSRLDTGQSAVNPRPFPLPRWHRPLEMGSIEWLNDLHKLNADSLYGG
jgi:hypothetical protein